MLYLLGGGVTAFFSSGCLEDRLYWGASNFDLTSYLLGEGVSNYFPWSYVRPPSEALMGEPACGILYCPGPGLMFLKADFSGLPESE